MTEIKAVDLQPVLPSEPRSTNGNTDKTAGSDIRPEQKAPASEQSRDPLSRAAEIVEAHFKSVSGIQKRLTMEKNEEAGVVVYKAIDRDTGEVIKQFPPEDLLKLLTYYRRIEGLALDAKA